MTILLIISKLIPLLALILLGKILKQVNFISDDNVAFLKKLVINVGIPAVLFLSFSTLSIEIRYLWVIVGVFLLNLLLFGYGKIIFKRSDNPNHGFLLTGFEYGMFALALFTVAYSNGNNDAVSYIAVVDLGHELFIWFLFVPAMQAISSPSRDFKGVLLSFIKSPIIIAIVGGLVFNLTGLTNLLANNFAWQGITNTLSMVGSITSPLILIVLGAGLSFTLKDLKFSARIILLRLPIILIIYFMADFWLFRQVLKLDFGFSAALFVLLTSPPPFILPIYLKNKDKAGETAINTALATYTLVSLLLFIVYFSVYPNLGI